MTEARIKDQPVGTFTSGEKIATDSLGSGTRQIDVDDVVEGTFKEVRNLPLGTFEGGQRLLMDRAATGSQGVDAADIIAVTLNSVSDLALGSFLNSDFLTDTPGNAERVTSQMVIDGVLSDISSRTPGTFTSGEKLVTDSVANGVRQIDVDDVIDGTLDAVKDLSLGAFVSGEKLLLDSLANGPRQIDVDDVIDGIPAPDAIDVPFDPSSTPLISTNVQDAIEEVEALAEIQTTTVVLAYDALAPTLIPLIGDEFVVSAGEVGDFATLTSMRGEYLRIIVNLITAGGDIVVIGDSFDPTTGVATLGDIETITVDTSAPQSYITDKRWHSVTSVNVSAGSITGINYDIEGLLFGDLAAAAPLEQVLIGWKGQWFFDKNSGDVDLQIAAYQHGGSDKKIVETLLEDMIFSGTGGNGTVTDNLRTAGADRSYTYGSEMVPDDQNWAFRTTDFNAFFSGGGENIIDFSGGPSGFRVQSSSNQIEFGSLTFFYQIRRLNP